jgi:hypothetical protein
MIEVLRAACGLMHRDAPTTVLFAGIFLTGFGSSYYHLDPNDSTLFWDRLPMTICFAAILSAVVEERVDGLEIQLPFYPRDRT